MAKTIINKVSDDFDLDSNLDLSDFNFDDLEKKDNRKPVIKVISAIPKGALDAVRDTSFIKSTIKQVLPTGFGQTIDAYDNINRTARNLYDESAREIKPAVKEFKRIAEKLVPKESKLVPDAIKKLLKRWEDQRKAELKILSPDQQRESMLSDSLKDIFKAQSMQMSEAQASKDGMQRLQQGIDLNRHRDMFGAAASSAASLSRLDQYNTNITAKYQRKSLELQYRQLFAIQDLIETSRKTAAQRDEYLSAIVKNTGLPDSSKIGASSITTSMFKNKFAQGAYEGLFGGASGMSGKFTDNFRETVNEKVKNITSGIMMALSGAEMAKEGADMAKDMPGFDAHSQAGGFVGGLGGTIITSKIADMIKSKIAGGKLDKRFGLVKKGQKIENAFENTTQHLNNFKNSTKFDEKTGLTGFAIRLMQDLIPQMGIDTKTQIYKGKDMEQPYAMTRRTDRSLNEIIPGYLSRILREVQILRTGNNKIALTQYDFDAAKFTSKDKLEKGIFTKIIKPLGVENTKKQLDDLLKDIDPEGKLSEETKKALKKTLLTKSANKVLSNKENLANPNAYGKASDKVKKEASDVMEKYLDSLDDQKRLVFSRKYNNLTSNISDTRSAIQEHLDLGHTQALKKMGVISKDGEKIDLDKILDHYVNEDNAKGAKPEAAAAKKRNLIAAVDITKLNMMKTAMTDKVSDTASNVMGKAKNIASSIPDLGIAQMQQSLMQKAANFKQAVSDVFVQGDVKPRLLAYKFKMGSYKDAFSKLPIFHQDEVKGAVMDENNNTVVSEEDVPNLKVFDPKTKSLISLDSVRASLGKMGQMYNKYTQQGLSSLIALKDLATEKYIALKDRILDVYVKGEVEPRMLAVKIKAGHYRDEDSQEVITHQDKIKGPVRDEENKRVVAAEDIENLTVYDPYKKQMTALRVVFGAAKWIGSKLWYYQTKIAPKWVAWNFKTMYSGVKFVARMLTKGKIRDVFIQGEEEPRLYATKLKAGQYFDANTKKPIYHQNDIKGAIIDDEGVTVLREDELDKMQVYNNILRIFNPLKLVGLALKGIGKAAKYYQTKIAPWLVGKAMSGIKMGAKAIRATGAFGVRMLTKPFDVYASNSKKPILDNIGFTEGKYKNSTGKIITHPNQIDGAVFDSVTGETILSEDNFKDGLYRVDGRPLKVGILGGIGKTLGKINRLFSRRVALRNPKGMLVPSALKGATQTEIVAEKSLTTLEQIKGLVSKMVGGKKGKGKDAAGMDATGSSSSISAKGKGILGIAGVGAGAIGDKDKPAGVPGDKEGDNSGLINTAEGAAGAGALGWLGKKLGFGAKVLPGAVAEGATVAAKPAGLLARGLSKIGLKGKLGLLAGAGLLGLNAFTGDNAEASTVAAPAQSGLAKTLVDTAEGGGVVGGASYLAGKLGAKGAGAAVAPAVKSGSLLKTGLAGLKSAFSIAKIGATLIPAAAGYLTDGVAGKLGVGNNEIDEKQDDENWKNATFAEKFQSGMARGIEKAGEFLFLDNFANQAKAKRIKAETEYLSNKNGGDGKKVKQEGAKMPPMYASTNDLPGDLDGEESSLDASDSNSAGGGDTKNSTPTNLQMAGGPVLDGRNAMAFLNMKSGVTLNNVNPNLLKNFYGMVEEYGTLTGKKVSVNSGFRTFEQQEALRQKYGNRAALPGKSLHEYGLALDVDSNALNEIDKLGLMRKYGFTRPIGGEPWHMEPTGIQLNPDRYKTDPSGASAAIDAGVGKGGGGYGTVDGATKYARNAILAKNILESTVDATNLPKKDDSPGIFSKIGTAIKNLYVSKPTSPSDVGNKNGMPGSGSANDGETPAFDPMGNITGTTNISQPQAGVRNGPADPTVKIPDPKGDGYLGMKDTIEAAAKLVGVDSDLMIKVAAVESGFKANSAAGTSTAKGLFQFTNDTWAEVIKKYGAQYGYTLDTSPNDAKANSIMAAHFIKNNMSSLSKSIGRDVNATEAYMTHFMGLGGATKFLNNLSKDPMQPGINYVSDDTAKANANIFFNGNTPRSASEVYTLLQNKVNNTAAKFGLTNSSIDTAMSNKPNLGITTSSNTPVAVPVMAAAAGAKSMALPEGSGYMRTGYDTPTANKTAGAAGAAAITTDAGASPLADAFGFKPMQAIANERPGNTPSQMGKDLFADTNGLLSQSLDVQKKMLDTLNGLFGLASGKPVDNKANTDAVGPNNTPNVFTIPQAPVSMKRALT
jgi:hypothetical protein